MIEAVKTINTSVVNDKTEMTIIFPKRELYSFKYNLNGQKEYPSAAKDVTWTFIISEPIFSQEEEKKKRTKNDKKAVQQMQADLKN
jgi:hypothetical protein